MQTVDVNSLFARAEQGFIAGRLDEARRDLLAVGRAAGDHPAVLHLLALVEKKSGNRAAARDAFERALRLTPRDSRLLGNYANLLGDLGESEAALRRYDEALAIDPSFADARLNRAVLLGRIGRPADALADLDALLAAGARSAKLHAARGAALLKLRSFDEAADAFEAALAIEPERPAALHGRARVAMERGEAGASGLYRRALAGNPGDRELQLGLAEALETEGEAEEGIAMLRKAVAADPTWLEGLQSLARMRSEAGDADDFAGHFRDAIAARPRDLDLHFAYWNALSAGDRHGEARDAIEAARSRFPGDPGVERIAALMASEAGDAAAAEAALARLDRAGIVPAGADDGLARARIALKARRAEEAAALLADAVAERPDFVSAWAHLDIAWRMTGDPRHQWLSGQDGLYGPSRIGLSDGELTELAAVLRTLHRSRAHPIGQSLRGGTQTRGQLFLRKEPEIVRLRAALEEAVRGFVAALPPRDESHPLLRHRDADLAITGSWSVRLTGKGFHVNHLHPEGVLSSACYIALPGTIGDDSSRDGWLELGRPPRELQLDLEPLAAIEPKVGRLALFPSYLFHGTRPFADGERMTVAFDVARR